MRTRRRSSFSFVGCIAYSLKRLTSSSYPTRTFLLRRWFSFISMFRLLTIGCRSSARTIFARLPRYPRSRLRPLIPTSLSLVAGVEAYQAVQGWVLELMNTTSRSLSNIHSQRTQSSRIRFTLIHPAKLYKELGLISSLAGPPKDEPPKSYVGSMASVIINSTLVCAVMVLHRGSNS
jgi:hypothetical protein